MYLVCLFLQCTLIGWLPAAIWAVSSYNKEITEKRTDKIVEAIKNNKQ